MPETSGRTHRVEMLETEKLIHSVANEMKNKHFFFKLNSAPSLKDGVANDVRYHLSCWARNKKEAQRIERAVIDNEENIGHILAEIEFINLIECQLNYPSKKS